MASIDRRTSALCGSIRRGHEQSVRDFYTDWFPTLLSWSTSFIPSDEHLALDIVQETMIRVIRSLPALDSHAALVAWLRAANRSAAIDLLRRRVASQARERAAARPESSDSVHPQHHGKSAFVGDDRDFNALTQALATLSPDDQLLLRLRSDSSASFEQLASSFGGTPDSLYGRARRALARLRTLLSEESSDA
ncbi:MAG: sigma-70 family RNA polymerase sigma factor [Phycisphaerales bacterium]|nr:sigma-70 family RNA polymerase sigma factor [Phycisphaerales bacterium]